MKRNKIENCVTASKFGWRVHKYFSFLKQTDCEFMAGLQTSALLNLKTKDHENQTNYATMKTSKKNYQNI